MAKAKREGSAHYELLYIVSNKYAENELGPIISKVNKIIEDNKGKISFREEWGKRKLAFPIGGFGYGYYNLVEFDAEGASASSISRSLRLTNEVLRSQIVAKKVKTEAEIRKEKEITAKMAAKTIEKEKLEKEKENVKGKLDLKDLDKKLDRILETDDLL